MMAVRMSVAPADSCAASAQVLRMWLSCLMSCSKSGLVAVSWSGRMYTLLVGWRSTAALSFANPFGEETA